MQLFEKKLLWWGTWIHLVVEISPLIHPDFRNSGGILVDYLGNTTRKRVRGLVPKHVAYM